jgi:hypothetical protein
MLLMTQAHFQHDGALDGCDNDSHMVTTAGESSVEAIQSYGPPAGSQAPKAADLRIRDRRSILQPIQARMWRGWMVVSWPVVSQEGWERW